MSMPAQYGTPRVESPDLQFDPAMILEQLGRDLYPNDAARLWEPIRNGHVAGMLESDPRWDASRAAPVDIVITEHKGVRTAYICDRGRGLTQEDRDRMEHAGGGRSVSERAGGASKRQIGRFASLVLNSAFDDIMKTRPEDGITYYSRTAEDVRLNRLASELTINLRCITLRKAFEREANTIALNDPRLGPFRNQTGTFTLLVIPNFTMTVEQIRKELPYYLPRKADRQLKLTLNGEPLRGHIVDARRYYGSDNGDFEIYLSSRNPNSPIKHEAEGDIVLCDADSGCVVATLRDSATNAVQSYLRDDRLCGAVFYPGLFGRTNTGRTALNPTFWTKSDGRRLAHYLNSSATFALVSSVLNGDVRAENDDANKELSSVFQMLENGFGPRRIIDLVKRRASKDSSSPETPPPDSGPGRDPPTGDRPGADPPTPDPNPKPTPPKPPPEPRKELAPILVLPIGDRQYVLSIERNDRSGQVARQPLGETQTTIHGETFSIISVNPEWKGSKNLTATHRTQFMIFEILRVAAEYVAPRMSRDRDEIRASYWTDVCKGAWKSKQ